MTFDFGAPLLQVKCLLDDFKVISWTLNQLFGQRRKGFFYS